MLGGRSPRDNHQKALEPKFYIGQAQDLLREQLQDSLKKR